MSKVRPDFLLLHALWPVVLVGMILLFRLESPRLEYVIPWVMGAGVVLIHLLVPLSHRDRLVLLASGVGILSLALVGDVRASVLLCAIELLMIQALDREAQFLKNWRYYFSASLGICAFVAPLSPEWAPFIWLGLIGLKSLALPAREALDVPSETIEILMLPISLFTLHHLSGWVLPDGAEVILGALALVNIILGRTIPAATCALFSFLKIEPQVFVFLGPMMCFFLAGQVGLRALSVVGAAGTILLLISSLSPEAVSGAVLGSSAFGLIFWSTRETRRPWIGLGLAAMVGGAAIYLNLDWLLETQTISTGEELAGVVSWSVFLLLGRWLRKSVLPLRMKWPVFSLATPEWNPQIELPKIHFGLLHQICASWTFVSASFLVVATLLVWAVGYFL